MSKSQHSEAQMIGALIHCGSLPALEYPTRAEREKGEELMSKSQHSEAQMIGALIHCGSLPALEYPTRAERESGFGE